MRWLVLRIVRWVVEACDLLVDIEFRNVQRHLWFLHLDYRNWRARDGLALDRARDVFRTVYKDFCNPVSAICRALRPYFKSLDGRNRLLLLLYQRRHINVLNPVQADIMVSVGAEFWIGDFAVVVWQRLDAQLRGASGFVLVVQIRVPLNLVLWQLGHVIVFRSHLGRLCCPQNRWWCFCFLKSWLICRSRGRRSLFTLLINYPLFFCLLRYLLLLGWKT